MNEVAMVKTATMIFVFPIKGQAALLAKLKALIKATGCVLVCEDAPPSDWEECLAKADVMVVLICPQIEGDITVDKAVARAGYDGKRVVGVWAPESDGGKLPAGLHRHGHAVISMDADHIRASVCGSATVWLLPDGSPRPAPKTPRHKG